MANEKNRNKTLKTSRRRVNPHLRRQQILEAAMQVFAEKGFAAATIPQIAGRAGVAAGTIYLYYPNKRDLFVAVIENLIILPLKDIFTRESADDFLPAMRKAFQDRVSIMQSDRPAGLVSLMGEIQRDPELKKRYGESLIRPFLANMEKYYARQAGQEESARREPALMVRAIGGMMLGLIVLKGLEGESSPFNRIPAEKAVDQLIDFVLYGLMGRPE